MFDDAWERGYPEAFRVNMLVYEPYEMNMGISVAANLREAFKVSELLQTRIQTFVSRDLIPL